MKFVAPEMEIKAFSTEEILTASSEPTASTKENTLPEDDFE